MQIAQKFNLQGKVFIVTGGAGLLGLNHAQAIAENGGTVVILDLDLQKAEEAANSIQSSYRTKSYGYRCDITNEDEILNVCEYTKKLHGSMV